MVNLMRIQMTKPTSTQVLELLQQFDLRNEGNGQYRSNRPWSKNSDSLGLAVKIDGPEFGTYFDHVDDKGGSLYDLAERLGISPNGYKPTDTKRRFDGLEEYAKAHGVPRKVYLDAQWKKTTYQDRPALEFPTKTGKRWRFLDDDKPTFKSEKGYKPCWYGIDKAIEKAKAFNQPLVICNGEPSVISAHYYGVAVCAVTSGEKSKIPNNLLDELKDKWSGEIIIAPDCDETGRKMAEGFVNQLVTWQKKDRRFEGV